MIGALAALVLLLVLIACALGVGIWVRTGSGFLGDRAGKGGDSGSSSDASATNLGTDASFETADQEAASTKPSTDDPSPTEDQPTPAVDHEAAQEKVLPPKDISLPVIGKEVGSSGPDRDEAGRSVAGGTFFGLRADGKRFIYVVDCSGSMTGLPYRRATMELLSSIANLEESQQFFVILYSTESYPMFHPVTSQEFLLATDEALKQTKLWLKGFTEGEGGTNPESALEQALAMKPDAIFFLTDGAIPPTTLDTIRQVNGRKTPIHTVGFVSRTGETVLKQIAEENEGQYKFVP